MVISNGVDKYQKKRVAISIIWLVIFGLLFFGAYRLFVPRATCTDGIKNQNEEDVDCGGVCSKCQRIEAEPLVVLKAGFTDSGIVGKRDFYALVKNPNNSFGSKVFAYTASIKDSQGGVLISRSGKSFILPGEEKYIVETNLDAENPVTASLDIHSSDWIEFSDAYEKPNVRVVNKEYNPITGGTEFAEAKGLLKNESSYDFDSIKIQVILLDKGRNVIGLNSTLLRTVNSAESRDFRIAWPSRISGEVSDMITQADINVFDSQNFIKRYYKSEQFRNY